MKQRKRNGAQHTTAATDMKSSKCSFFFLLYVSSMHARDKRGILKEDFCHSNSTPLTQHSKHQKVFHHPVNSSLRPQASTAPFAVAPLNSVQNHSSLGRRLRDPLRAASPSSDSLATRHVLVMKSATGFAA
jgi:hypothetical protein